MSLLFPFLYRFLLPVLYLLAGCSTEPDPALLALTPPHTPAESAYIAPDFFFTASDGLKIPFRLYAPPQTDKQEGRKPPKAVILALHGFGDSRNAWEGLTPTLTEQGILLAAPDIRSFGEAGQANMAWPGTDRLQDDTLEELAFLHQHYPQIPLYLMGESMGGAIALLANRTLARHHTVPVSGTILLSPAVMTLHQPWRALLAGWNFLAPDHILTSQSAPGPRRIASTNQAAMRRMFFDPLTRHGSRVGALHGLVVLMADADRAALEAQPPLLVIFGDRDDFVPSSAYETLFKTLPKGTVFDEINGGRHLLSRQQSQYGRDLVGDDSAAWILTPQKALPSGGELAASTWLAAR